MGGRWLSMGGRVPPRPPYNLSTGCTHVLLYAKMLKKLKWKKQQSFCDIFIIGNISIGGGRRVPWAPPGYAYGSFVIPTHFSPFFFLLSKPW